MRTLSKLGLGAVLLAAPLAAPASAQVTGGVKAGLNVASFGGDDTGGLDPRLGVAAGLQARYDVSPSFAIQVEALYSQKGADDGGGLDGGTFKLDYIEVPVLLRFGVPLSRFADAGAYVGPSVAFPVSGEFDSEIGDGLDIDYDGDLSTDVGVAIGVDYYAGPVGIDLRYTTGLTDVSDDRASLQGFRNQAFTVSLGYRFGGGAPRYGGGRRY